MWDSKQMSCSAVPIANYFESESRTFQNLSSLLVQKTGWSVIDVEKVPKIKLTMELGRSLYESRFTILHHDLFLHHSARSHWPRKVKDDLASRARAENPSLSNTALPSFLMRDGRFSGEGVEESYDCTNFCILWDIACSKRNEGMKSSDFLVEREESDVNQENGKQASTSGASVF